jgi:tRNA-uridine 2-sulfurtransferase
MKTIAIGMSGGVDSSVAAMLLKEQGYRVIGLFMKNWDEEGECPAVQDEADVAAVCGKLDIPYYTVNFTKEYWDEVFSHFLDGLKKGLTPNPDILCNREIKFHHFLNKALEIGADKLATGHYCQVSDEGLLLRGNDPDKDQTYFTYTLTKEKLKKVLFPIGHLPKKEVRLLAEKANLPTATKKDSTGICFIGKRNFRDFMSQYLKPENGPLIDDKGNRVGTHIGTPFYTIGQRKGLGIGGPGDPWFVSGKEGNTVYVVQGHDHPALFAKSLTMTNTSWVADPPPRECTAKVRYRQTDIPCIVEGNRVTFPEDVWAATPGQSIVFYNGPICLGGGIIDNITRK